MSNKIFAFVILIMAFIYFVGCFTMAIYTTTQLKDTIIKERTKPHTCSDTTHVKCDSTCECDGLGCY